jgi:type I restriction enzyme S subunit
VKSGELGDSVVYETAERITEQALESSNAKVFPKGTLCIALYGATVGKLGILGIDAATNQAVCAVFPPDGLDTRYLYRFFESIRGALVEQGKGGAQPNISQGIIRDTEIPLPPLDEQQRIVAEIEKQFTRVDAGVTALRRVQANLKRYRAAVLKAACEGRLVPTEAELAKTEKGKFETGEELLARILNERRQKWQGRGKYKEPDEPDTDSLTPLPEGWTWASLDQLLQHITDGDHLPPPQTESGVPFLVIGNVRNGKLSFADTRFVLRAYYGAIEPYRKPQLGDILYSLVGSYGIALRVDTDREFCIQRHIGIMRPHALSPSSFLVHVLNSRFIFQQATASATGTAQKTVPLAGLRRFIIPLPPLAEQIRIVTEVERRLSVVEELEAVVSANLQRATRLRQAILQPAFGGNLVIDVA